MFQVLTLPHLRIGNKLFIIVGLFGLFLSISIWQMLQTLQEADSAYSDLIERVDSMALGSARANRTGSELCSACVSARTGFG